MALFDENLTIVPAPKPPMRRSTKVGIGSLTIALLALLGLSFLPTGYVIQQPGPVYNTLGTVTSSDGTAVPLIEVEGAESYDTSGALDLTTVQVVGNRERTPSWLELAQAWFDPSRAVVPIGEVFPANVTTEQRTEQNAQAMVNSQHEATVAALRELDYQVDSRVGIYSIPEGSAAEGILEPDDIVLAVDGTDITDVSQLRDAIQAKDGAPVTLTIERDGAELSVEVTPVYSEKDSAWQIGVSTISDYDFPVQVTIQLDNVGGPSAGLMFALGIIDTMTPGDLNGGKQVAGTGTITADGEVGAIGGIRQKLYGARNAGAEYFLAPETNCDDVVGHVPSGLRVFSVGDLDDALAALQAISEGGDLDALPTCDAS